MIPSYQLHDSSILVDLVSNTMLVASSNESSEAKHEAIHALEIIDEQRYQRLGDRLIHIVTSTRPCRPERVKFILREFTNKFVLFSTDFNKNTALHLAAETGQADLVQMIIDEASNLPAPPSSLNNCLITIIREPNDAGNTALHIAAIHRDIAFVKLLVEADPHGRHTPNCYSETPLYIATKLGYVDIIKLMFSWFEDLSLYGPGGTTVLHAALAKIPEADPQEPFGRDELLRLLLRRATRTYTFPSKDDYHKFVGKGDDQCQNTALHLAVLGNHISVVEQIIEAFSTYRHDDKNSESKNPIHIAVEQGNESIVKALRKNYFSVEDISAFVSGPKHQTVLHGAVIGRHTACVELVLKSHSDLVNFCDEDGWTPLHHAAHLKFDSVLEWLINAQTRHGFKESQLINRKISTPTPLWLATKGGHSSTVTKLMKLWPNLCVEVNHQDRQNILHLAAFQSDKETIQSILKSCPQHLIDKLLMGKDVRRDTPLHLLIKDDVIGDQLQIKKAIDDVEADKHSYFWPRSNKLKSKLKPNTQESLVPPSKQSTKDAKFKIAKKDLMKVELKLYRQRTNTQIIVTALITTVTFTVGFTMPGGYYQSGQINQGSVLLSKKAAFIAFMVSDAIALALSTTSLFLYFISSMYEDPHHVSKLNFSSSVLNLFSVVAMMATFITGTYVVLSHSPALAITVCIICSTFFACIFYLLIKLGCDRDKLKDILV